MHEEPENSASGQWRSRNLCTSGMDGYVNKKAVLSQRWPHNAPYGCPENFRDSLTTPTATIPTFFHGLLFRSTLWMFVQNLKSIALPVPEIIRGTQKFGQPLYGYAHAPFLQNFLWPFIRIGPVNVLAKFEVSSFSRSRDNRRYPKLGQSLDMPTLHFLQNF